MARALATRAPTAALSSPDFALAFTHHDNHFALAGLIPPQAAVAAVFLVVGGLHVSTKICPVDFYHATNLISALLSCHSLADFMRQYESSFILHI